MVIIDVLTAPDLTVTMLTRNVCSPIDLPVAPLTDARTQVVQPPSLAGIGNENLMLVGKAVGVNTAATLPRMIEPTSGGCSMSLLLGARCLRMSGM
jgi:hypothetical protein